MGPDPIFVRQRRTHLNFQDFCAAAIGGVMEIIMSFKRKIPGAYAAFCHARSERPDVNSFERHFHPNYELLYVVEGEGSFIVEGEEFPLTDNTALLMHPYQYHYVRLQEDHPYERYIINFDPELLIDPADKLPILASPDFKGRVCFTNITRAKEIRAALGGFVTVASALGDGDTELVSASARAAITQSLLLLSRESTEIRELDDKIVSRVVEFVNRNIASELSLEGLAHEFFISKYYLCRSFRARVGVSLFEYIAGKRYALAQGYLEQGIPAQTVAELVGYRDYSSFYRAYVKRAGHPPVRERNK